MKRILIAVLIVLICAAGGFAEPLVEFEGRYWITNFNSKLRVSDGGLGTEINLKSDLGMKSENFPEGRFTWVTGKNSRIRIAYTQESFSGDNVLARAIEFGGKTYPANTTVLSNLDIKYGRVSWIWQFINIADIVKFGTEVDAKIFDLKANLSAPNMDINESKHFSLALPTLGLAVDVSPPVIPLDVFAEATGMAAGKYIKPRGSGLSISVPVFIFAHGSTYCGVMKPKIIGNLFQTVSKSYVRPMHQLLLLPFVLPPEYSLQLRSSKISLLSWDFSYQLFIQK